MTIGSAAGAAARGVAGAAKGVGTAAKLLRSGSRADTNALNSAGYSNLLQQAMPSILGVTSTGPAGIAEQRIWHSNVGMQAPPALSHRFYDPILARGGSMGKQEFEREGVVRNERPRTSDRTALSPSNPEAARAVVSSSRPIPTIGSSPSLTPPRPLALPAGPMPSRPGRMNVPSSRGGIGLPRGS